MDLSELHDAVKLHPYRKDNNEQYLKNYTDLLFKLSDKFYFTIKDHLKYSFSDNMIHDFNGAIMNVNRKTWAVEHIERCLGTIHTFIDTREIPYFYTYYTGCLILKAESKLRKFIYNEEKNKYIGDYTKQELGNCIKEIEEYYKIKPGKWHDFGQYSKSSYDYYKRELKE